jgi:hypothetical protein
MRLKTYPDGSTGCQKCTTGRGGHCVDYNCKNNKCTTIVVRGKPSAKKPKVRPMF